MNNIPHWNMIQSSKLSSSCFGGTTSVVVLGSKEDTRVQRDSVSPTTRSHQQDKATCSSYPPKKVAFSRKVRVKLVSSRDCYSEEEQFNMWYSSEEYMDIRQRAIDTVTKMAKKQSRGLGPKRQLSRSRGTNTKTRRASARAKKTNHFVSID